MRATRTVSERGNVATAMLLGVDHRGYIAAFEARPDNAAHSMDTDWYAVDRSGHVARLWSGEEGAVPWDAHRQYWAELFEDLTVARVETLTLSVPSHRRILAVDHEIHAIEYRDLPSQWNGVLRFANRDYLEMFRAEYYHDRWRVLDAVPDAVVAEDILKQAFDDYWRAGAIVGAYVIGGQVSPRSIGLFEYACGFRGPYRRAAVPAEPILLESLPSSLQGKLGAVRMSKLDFHMTTDVDPVDFFRCHEYGS